MFWVYILRSQRDGKLYVGHCENFERRLSEHPSGHGGKYTRGRGPWELVHREPHPDRSAAMKRERYLKSVAGSREKRLPAGRSMPLRPLIDVPGRAQRAGGNAASRPSVGRSRPSRDQPRNGSPGGEEGVQLGQNVVQRRLQGLQLGRASSAGPVAQAGPRTRMRRRIASSEPWRSAQWAGQVDVEHRPPALDAGETSPRAGDLRGRRNRDCHGRSGIRPGDRNHSSDFRFLCIAHQHRIRLRHRGRRLLALLGENGARPHRQGLAVDAGQETEVRYVHDPVASSRPSRRHRARLAESRGVPGHLRQTGP